MKRRTVLASAYAGLTTVAAGCISQTPSSGAAETGSETAATTSGDTQTETELSGETLIEAGDTAERVIGDESLEERGLRNAHRVAFGNRTGDTHHGAITVSKAGETVFEEAVEFEASATLTVSLTDLDTYTARLTVPELDATEAVTIDPRQFTCNVAKTAVSIQDDSTLDSMGMSTRMACPSVVTERASADKPASHTLGDNSTPADTGRLSHTLVLQNSSNKTWTTRILAEKDATPLFDGVYTVEPEGTVAITLSRSGTYSLSVGVFETALTVTEQVTPEDFDCDQSSTRAEITAAEDLIVNTVSTLTACDAGMNSTNESS